MRADPVTLLQVVIEARRWLGVSWRHQGGTRAGVDCAGLVVKVAHALKQTDYDNTSYGRRPNNQDFVSHFRAGMDAIRVAEAQPGDVLVFAENAYPCHCGILSEMWGRAHLLHAHITRRKVVEEPYIGEWPAKVRFAFRFRGVR